MSKLPNKFENAVLAILGDFKTGKVDFKQATKEIIQASGFYNEPKSTNPDTPTNTASVDAPEDLQDQVRAHIRNDKLFNWDEALSDNEMTYLEQLLLTFNPLCPPGSIGFEEQVRHIAKHRAGASTSQHRDVEVLTDALQDIDLESDFVDPPSNVKRCGEIARKALKKFVQSQSTPTPPLFLDKLRADNPYHVAYEQGHKTSELPFHVWNECCDMAATLLSEKGEGKKFKYLEESNSFHNDDDLATDAIDFYWRHCMDQLNKKDLGDIERKKYESIAKKLEEKLFPRLGCGFSGGV
jgi:hypothetical protein